MRLYVKTSLAAVLFLVPFAIVCSRPIPKNSGLVPLPFKAQARQTTTLMNLEKIEHDKAVSVKPLPIQGAPAEIQRPSEPDLQKMKKLSFNYGVLEAQERGAVRLKGAKVGVDYHVDDQQSVSVESSQQVYDREDAKAWGKGGEDESTAGIKYKLIF